MPPKSEKGNLQVKPLKIFLLDNAQEVILSNSLKVYPTLF